MFSYLKYKILLPFRFFSLFFKTFALNIFFSYICLTSDSVTFFLFQASNIILKTHENIFHLPIFLPFHCSLLFFHVPRLFLISFSLCLKNLLLPFFKGGSASNEFSVFQNLRMSYFLFSLKGLFFWVWNLWLIDFFFQHLKNMPFLSRCHVFK